MNTKPMLYVFILLSKRHSFVNKTLCQGSNKYIAKIVNMGIKVIMETYFIGLKRMSLKTTLVNIFYITFYH